MNWTQQLFAATVLAALCTTALGTTALCIHYAKVIKINEDNMGPIPIGVENQAERAAMIRTHQAIRKKLSIFYRKEGGPDWLDIAANKINDFVDDVTN